MFAFSSVDAILSSILLLLPIIIATTVDESVTCHMIKGPTAILRFSVYVSRALNLRSRVRSDTVPITKYWKGSNRFANKVVYRKGDNILSHDDETGLTSFVGDYRSNDVNTATHQEAVALFKTSKDPDEFERKAKGKGELGHAVKFSVIDGKLCDTRFCYSDETDRWTIPNPRTSFDDGIYFRYNIYHVVKSLSEKKITINIYFRTGVLSSTTIVRFDDHGDNETVIFYTNKFVMNMVVMNNAELYVYNVQTGKSKQFINVFASLDGLMLPCINYKSANVNVTTTDEGSSTIASQTPITCGGGNVKMRPINTTAVLVAVMSVVLANI